MTHRVWMGLAAAGLVAITAGVTHLVTRRALTNAQPVRVTAQSPVPVSSTPVTSMPKPDTAQGAEPARVAANATRSGAAAPMATLASARSSETGHSTRSAEETY